MQAAIFIFFIILVSFAIHTIQFFKNSGIGKWTLTALFLLKVSAGIAYAKFYTLPQYYANSDTWRFYRLSLSETKWLLHNPYSFLKDLFYYGYNDSGNLFSGKNTYWNDLKSNLPVKLMAVCNVFTNNSYYTNIILFNFLFLPGLVALFKVMSSFYPSKKWNIIFGVFLLPSTIFWCSGIHKDGLILSALGVSIYCFQKILAQQFSFKHLLLMLLSFLLIFALRNYVLFLLLASLFCWWLANNFTSNKNYVFCAFYLVAIICFFITPVFFPSINPPGYISSKQHEFLELKGTSKVYVDTLQPTFASFINYLPKAIDMAVFRPHPNEFKNLSYIPAIAENILLFGLIVISIISINRHKKIYSFTLALLLFAISVLIVCGYTIPFTGAIVRYKSMVLPFVITPLLCVADFSFLRKKQKTKTIYTS